MEGDSQKDQLLTEARAMVVRTYLVENFGFDDSQLKTLGMGKQTGAKKDAEWGTIQILLYPVGVAVPPTVDQPAPIAAIVDVDHSPKQAEGLAKKQ